MNKKTSNASKKPTSLLTLVNRTYRKVLAIEKDLVHANEEICAMRNRHVQMATRVDIMLYGADVSYGAEVASNENLPTLPAIRESINDVIQMMHLYQTHFEELTKRQEVRCDPTSADHSYNFVRCADTRKAENPAAAPHDWLASSAPQGRADCRFAHLHTPGIVCAVCGALNAAPAP